MKYDHPFAGELTVFVAKDQAQVRTMCPNAKFPPIGALGCALRHPDGKQCWVILAPDADIVAAGHTTEIVKRHEIGHCNGWSDHAGARAFEEWAEPPSIADVAAQFDEFARKAVGKTVAEVADDLQRSNMPAAGQFAIAAMRIGFTPRSQLTGQILSNPGFAMLLAKAAGIGNHLSDAEWQEAHALAFQASKARQAENAAAASHSVLNLGQAAPQPQQAQPPPSGTAPR